MTLSNPYKGFGICPLGTVPFGYGAPATATPNIGQALARSDGTEGESRLIDPISKDYVVDPTTGRMLGEDGVNNLVYLAVATVKNSSAVLGLGQSFTSVKMVSSNIVAQMTDLVNQALASLVARNLISIESVDVQSKNSQALILVKWRNVRTSQLNLLSI